MRAEPELPRRTLLCGLGAALLVPTALSACATEPAPEGGSTGGGDPHQGTTVGAPQGGTITCPNHGSQFAAATGEVTNGPAARPLPPLGSPCRATRC
ncbi:MAG: Rieske 2Fe-2S domain-containing protein [Pseudonocardiaceae bacterium]|nr:Rieske 2Fe-2S domain-containing protein [Pseudonocardiaceae bacterium]